MVEVLMVLSFLVSIAFGGLVAAALVTYVRRTWQLVRAEEEGSSHDRILDGLDEIRLRLDTLGDRLERMERSLDGAVEPGEERDRLPPGDPS